MNGREQLQADKIAAARTGNFSGPCFSIISAFTAEPHKDIIVLFSIYYEITILFIYLFLLAVTLFFILCCSTPPPYVLNLVIRYPYQVLVLNSLCPLLFWAKVSFSLRTHPGMLLSNIFEIFLHQTSCLQLRHELLKILLSVELETITFGFLFLQNDLLRLLSSRRPAQRARMRSVGKNSGRVIHDSWSSFLDVNWVQSIMSQMKMKSVLSVHWKRLKGPKATPFFKGFYPWLMSWE